MLFNEKQWLLCRGEERRAPRIPTPPCQRWSRDGGEKSGRRNSGGGEGVAVSDRELNASIRQVRVDDSASAHRLIPECRIRESVSPAPSDRFGQCAKTGLQPSAPECTLSLAGPLIIYPYWTQFTLKLTGSRLVSPAKLTSKLTIYSRSIPLSSLSPSLFPSYPATTRLFVPVPLVVRSFSSLFRESIFARRKIRRNERSSARGERSIERKGGVFELEGSVELELSFDRVPFSQPRRDRILFYVARCNDH